MRRWLPLIVMIAFVLAIGACGKKPEKKPAKPKLMSEVNVIPGDGDTIPDKIIVKNVNNFAWHNVKMAYNNKYILSHIVDDSDPNSIVWGSKSIPVVQPGEVIETSKDDFRSQKGGTSTESIFGLTIQCDEGLTAKKFTN